MARKKRIKSKKSANKMFNKVYGDALSSLKGLFESSKQTILTDRLSKVYDLNKMISDENTDRVIHDAGVVERYGDFTYQDGANVPVGESYHIHYSRIGKTEIYMTGEKHDKTSLIINRVRGNTVFGQYMDAKPNAKGYNYLSEFVFKITNKHRKVGVARRYFAKEVNRSNSRIFEIEKPDFTKVTPLYTKTQLKWTLSDNKELMEKKNIEQINNAVLKGFVSLEYALNPIEGYIGKSVSTKEELAEKLKGIVSSDEVSSEPKKRKRKRKRKKKSSTPSTSSPSTTTSAPPSQNSGQGAY